MRNATASRASSALGASELLATLASTMCDAPSRRASSLLLAPRIFTILALLLGTCGRSLNVFFGFRHDEGGLEFICGEFCAEFLGSSSEFFQTPEGIRIC
jgi:hypothetical protein